MLLTSHDPPFTHNFKASLIVQISVVAVIGTEIRFLFLGINVCDKIKITQPLSNHSNNYDNHIKIAKRRVAYHYAIVNFLHQFANLNMLSYK